MGNQDNSQNSVIDGLMRRRTLVLEGTITQKSMAYLSDGLLHLQLQSSDPINLVINSGGGDTYASLEMCDLITNILRAPVHGIVIGKCGSAATFVLLHCTERVGTRYSRFMIHSGQMGNINIPVSNSTAEHLEQLHQDAKTTQELVIRLYMERLAKERDEVLKYIARGDQAFDEYMGAEEAEKIGLITRIVDGKLDIFD